MLRNLFKLALFVLTIYLPIQPAAEPGRKSPTRQMEILGKQVSLNNVIGHILKLQIKDGQILGFHYYRSNNIQDYVDGTLVKVNPKLWIFVPAKKDKLNDFYHGYIIYDGKIYDKPKTFFPNNISIRDIIELIKESSFVKEEGKPKVTDKGTIHTLLYKIKSSITNVGTVPDTTYLRIVATEGKDKTFINSIYPVYKTETNVNYSDILSALALQQTQELRNLHVPKEIGTDLMKVAKAGDIARISDLISQGADPNEKDEQGEYAINYAIKSGNDAVLGLITYENIDSKNNDGQTPLIVAIDEYTKKPTDERYNIISTIVSFLESYGYNVNTPDRFGRTPLMYVIGDAKFNRVSELLIDNGADLNLRDEDNYTPILKALEGNNDYIVRYAMEHNLEIIFDDQVRKTRRGKTVQPILVMAKEPIKRELIDYQQKEITRKAEEVAEAEQEKRRAELQRAREEERETKERNFRQYVDLVLQALTADSNAVFTTENGAALYNEFKNDVLPDTPNFTLLLAAVDQQKRNLVTWLLSDNDVNVLAKDAKDRDVLDIAYDKRDNETLKVLIASNRFSDDRIFNLLSRSLSDISISVVNIIADATSDAFQFYALTRFIDEDNIRAIRTFNDRPTPLTPLKLSPEQKARLLFHAAGSPHKKILEYFGSRFSDLINIPDAQSRTPIFNAVARGLADKVKILVDNGANINHADNKGQTPLFIAVTDGLIDVVKALVEKGADITLRDNERRSALSYAPKGKRDEIERIFNQQRVIAEQAARAKDIEELKAAGNSPLHIAAYFDDVDAIKSSTDDVNAKNNEGETPLMVAAKRDNIRAVRELLKKENINVHLKDNKGNDILELAKKANREIYNLIKNKIDQDTESFVDASKKGDLKAVEKFINLGIDINIKDRNGQTALGLASYEGHNDIVDKLLNKGANPNIQNKNGDTALMLASDKGHKEIVDKLLDNGANPNIQPINGDTALIIASYEGHNDIVDKLLNKGANPNLQNTNGDTALILASDKGHKEIVDKLLDSGADPNFQNKNGDTALILASIHGYVDIVDKLLDKGANPNLQTIAGDTALILASDKGHKEIVDKLLDKKTNPNLQNKNGDTALILASSEGYKDIVDKLLDKGADPNLQNKNGDTALILASDKGHKEIVYKLLDSGADPNFQTITGDTALILVSDKGHKEIVDKLLDNGADPNFQNKNGDTALILASYKGHKEIVDKLLDSGADPNFQNKNGNTPLIVASYEGHNDIVDKLLNKRADPRLKNNFQQTALDMVKQQKNNEVIQIFKRHGIT